MVILALVMLVEEMTEKQFNPPESEGEMMSRVYRQYICSCCGGTRCEIVENLHEEPKTMNINIPKPCMCQRCNDDEYHHMTKGKDGWDE